MTDITPAHPPYDELADLARTLGHAHRLHLLEHIARAETSVEQLAERAGLSVANASQHLQHLRRAGFVQTRRDGKRVLYRLGAGPVLGVLGALRDYALFNRHAMYTLIEDSRVPPADLEAITRAALLERLHDDAVTLLDVRSPEEFAQGHLPGAINIPLAELERRLGELPVEQEIVAYCRGAYCVLSHEAATALQGHGFKVRRLVSGFEEWQAAGLDIEGRESR